MMRKTESAICCCVCQQPDNLQRVIPHPKTKLSAASIEDPALKYRRETPKEEKSPGSSLLPAAGADVR